MMMIAMAPPCTHSHSPAAPMQPLMDSAVMSMLADKVPH
jgi:hypothetical protein